MLRIILKGLHSIIRKLDPDSAVGILAGSVLIKGARLLCPGQLSGESPHFPPFPKTLLPQSRIGHTILLSDHALLDNVTARSVTFPHPSAS